MKARFQRPRRFEVYRANLGKAGDARVVVLSDDVPNALRTVVIACAVDDLEGGMDLSLPTYVRLEAEESGLDSPAVASPASPFTLPKAALIERLGALPRPTGRRIDAALRLALGYDEWPA